MKVNQQQETAQRQPLRGKERLEIEYSETTDSESD